MLHTKFQGHWSTGPGEEDFLRFSTIYGHGGHVGHVTQTIFLKALEAVNKIWFAIGPIVSEEKSFEIVDGRTTDDGACQYYKLPRSFRLR